MLGFGVGLRPKHYREFLETKPPVDWVEAISENFMGVGGRPLAVLEKVRRDRPVVLHGVSLGIASAEALDERYLKDWKALVERVEPAIVSDHLCWGRAHARYSHDLLPVPFTEETVAHVVERVTRVQEFLGRKLALENVSSYLTFAQSSMTEWEFLSEICARSGCELLLDVNNIFVSSRNHGFDPDAYLAGVPAGSVVQLHLAGHQRRPELIIDTHDGPVSDEVWALYARALGRFGAVSTLIEWDDGVPPLEVLLAEAEKARKIEPASTSEAGRQRPPVHPERSRVALGRRDSQHAHVQDILFSAICDPTPVSEEAQALVAPHPPLTSKARIEVYAEMYWLRMRDVLRDAFPKVRTGLGDELFDAVVADFLRAHPSTQASLDRLGAPFPAFLEDAQPEWAAVAALEWARAESFIAPDAAVVSFAELQAHPSEVWGELFLAAHPSVRVVPGQVVWRKGFQVFQATIAEREETALRELMVGAVLPALLAPFEDLDDGGVAAFEALQSWFAEDMVSSISRVGFAASRDRAD
jgi:uncharacterized protein